MPLPPLAPVIAEPASDAVADRQPKGLARKLLLATLAIPALAVALWYQRDPALAAYHLRLLEYRLAAADTARAEAHVLALLNLSARVALDSLEAARRWPLARRQWLADVLYSACEPEDEERSTFPRPSPKRVRAIGGLSAERLLKLVLELDPSNRDALLASAKVKFAQGDFRSCAANVEKILAEAAQAGSDGTYFEYLQLGRALFELDRYTEAETAFRQAAMMMPRYPDPLFYLITALERQANYREAVAVATRLLGFERFTDLPSYCAVLERRAVLLGLLGRQDLGLRDLDASLAFLKTLQSDDADDSDLLQRRAEVLSSMRAVSLALPLYDELLRRRPSSPETLCDRARALQDAGRMREAGADYREAILCGAQNPMIYNNCAWALLTAEDPLERDPAEALRLARKAVQLDTRQNPCYLDTLAEACYHNRLFAEAVRCETQALEKGGDSYRPSLERYRQAEQDARAGRNVILTLSPLKDHHKPPPGDGGVGYDPAQLPALARLPRSLYYEEVNRIREVPGDSSLLDAAARRLAAQWARFPAPALEDPREDLKTVFFALGHLPVTLSNSLTEPECDLLSGVLQLLMRKSPRRAEMLDEESAPLSIGSPRDRKDAAAFRLGLWMAEWLLTCSRAEAASFLTRLAEGKILLTEPLSAAGTALAPPLLSTPGTQQELRQRWEEVRKRYAQAASGEEIAPPEVRWKPPALPRRRALAPPPAGDGGELDLTPEAAPVE